MNNLKELLEEISDNYHTVLNESFTGHSLAILIRKEPKKVIDNILNNDDFTIKGSPGMGQWTTSPWIAVFNKNETDGAQEGIYVVYLFSDDMQRIYLTFNQGVTRLIKNNGRKLAHQKLKSKALEIRTNYQHLEDFSYDDKIDLSDSPPGSDYEKSTIFYKEYDSNNLPSNDELVSGLKKIVTFYENYLDESNVLTSDTDFTDKVGKVEEGKRLLRKHYARERNRRIVQEAKRKRFQEKGELRCDVCDFSFPEKYGDRGENFIEAHHTKLISEMKPGDKTGIEDISLVCSNCHRMIHRKMDNLSIENFRKIIR